MFSFFDAAIREFMDPRGRAEVGSTINNIPTSTIFGHSIHTYIFVGVLLAGLYFYVQNRAEWKMKLIWTVVATTLLLDFNHSINLWNNLQRNFTLFGGKTHDEKVALHSDPGFYHFLEFAKNKLNGVDEVSLQTPIDFFNQKAAYLLSPLHVVSKADILLTYGVPNLPDSSWHVAHTYPPYGVIYQKENRR